MNRGRVLVLALCAAAMWPGAAFAQVESHFPPRQMPPVLFPTYILALPGFEVQEVSLPLAYAREKPAETALGLRDLSKAPADARSAVELAQGGKFREAAAAGDELLKRPSDRYDEFTWDYLANAVAWSRIQLGDLKGASQAHIAAVARIEDAAVREYHRLAAAMLGAPGIPAAQMKDPAAYRSELRKVLAERLKTFERNVAAAKKNMGVAARTRHLSVFYEELRVFTAVDPEVANGQPLAAYRELADGLAVDIIPAMLRETQTRRDRVVEAFNGLIFQKDFRDWNDRIKGMWTKIRQLKRLCRMHHYLARMNLATAGESDRQFREAHALLFAVDNLSLVWQPLGLTRMIDNIPQLDLRCRVPYQETIIAPIGVTPVASGPVGVGWSRMGKMGGEWDKMTGEGWDKMDGEGWDKMNGDGWDKMDGEGWEKMDGGGWKKMDGSGWQRR